MRFKVRDHMGWERSHKWGSEGPEFAFLQMIFGKVDLVHGHLVGCGCVDVGHWRGDERRIDGIVTKFGDSVR